MLLEHSSADELVFGQRGAPRPVLIAGCVFLVFATLPLLAPGALTANRLLGACALAAVAAAMLVAGRPVKRSARIDLRGRVVTGLSGADQALGLAERYALVDGEDPDAPGPRYAVELVFANGAKTRLLEGPDPARLLSDLGRTLRVLPLPVAAGWGLPGDATPWLEAAQPTARERPPHAVEVSCDRRASQRYAGLTVLAGGLVIGIFMAVMLIARARRGQDVSLLSLLLSVFTIGGLLLAGAAVSTQRAFIRIDGEVRIEQRVLGFRTLTRLLSADSVRRAYPVAPDASGTALHVLLETTEGPVAVPCSGDAASRIERALASQSSRS